MSGGDRGEAGVRSERRGMAGTLRTRAILDWNSSGSFGIVSAAVGQAPIPPDAPSATVSPARTCGAFHFAVARNISLTFREFRDAAVSLPLPEYRLPGPRLCG